MRTFTFEIFDNTTWFTCVTATLWYLPAYLIFFLMINVMRKNQNFMYNLQKKELHSFAIMLLIMSILEISRNFLMYLLGKQCSGDNINQDEMNPFNCLSETDASFLVYFVLFEKLMGLETMIICYVILRFKKCEDYIAKFSKLQTMAIVSIH